MKKSIAGILSIIFVGSLCFTACGPSAKQKEEARKRVQDSIAAAEASMAAELERQADSIKIATEMKEKEDSLKAVIDKMNSKPKYTAPKKPKVPTKPSEVKAGTGRG